MYMTGTVGQPWIKANQAVGMSVSNALRQVETPSSTFEQVLALVASTVNLPGPLILIQTT